MLPIHNIHNIHQKVGCQLMSILTVKYFFEICKLGVQLFLVCNVSIFLQGFNLVKLIR